MAPIKKKIEVTNHKINLFIINITN
jgi:hypothetical protein